MNPATATADRSGRLSLAVNFYSASFMSAQQWYQPGPVDRGSVGRSESSTSGLRSPTLVASRRACCLFFRVGRIPWFKSTPENDPRIRDASLGLCFATTQTESFSLRGRDLPEHRRRDGASTRQSHAFEQTFGAFSSGLPIRCGSCRGSRSAPRSTAASRAIRARSRRSLGSGTAPLPPINSMFLQLVARDLDGSSRGRRCDLPSRRPERRHRHRAPSVHLIGSGGATYYTQSDRHRSRSQLSTTTGRRQLRGADHPRVVARYRALAQLGAPPSWT